MPVEYVGYIFLNHLPCVYEEVKMVNGHEEPCLILPIRQNQIRRGRAGNWFLHFHCSEAPPNENMQTHTISLRYENSDERRRIMRSGFGKKTERIGQLLEQTGRDCLPTINYKNEAGEIRCEGSIVLSDIPRRYVRCNSQNRKQYVEGLIFRSPYDPETIYTGTLCIDDIPRHYIYIHKETGKRYVKCVFKKSKYMDIFMNTHQLVLITKDGSEIEIGRFKEFKKIDEEAVEYQEPIEHRTTVTPKPIPKKIDGLNF